MRPSLHILALAVVACRSAGHTTPVPSPEANAALRQEIVAQLNRAAFDWNRGDLEGFLSDYAPESTTTFIDGRRARHGIDFIRQNYTRWFTAGARRDSLHFEEVEARQLSSTLTLVTARYILQRGGTVSSSGPFTLVMERRREGWRILHDHSSSDSP
jgi:ketosteroid isomerase-like protein